MRHLKSAFQKSRRGQDAASFDVCGEIDQDRHLGLDTHPQATLRSTAYHGHDRFPIVLLLCVLLLSPGSILRAQSPDELATAAAQARDANDIPRALTLYHQAVAANPQWADGWWFLGSTAYGADDYATAREALTHYLALKPNAAPALALRGLSAYQAADYDAALIDIEQALALGAANEPRNALLLRLHEGLLLTRAGQFERAIPVWMLVARDPAAPPVATLGLGLAGLRIAALPAAVPADQQDLAFAAGQAALALSNSTAATSKEKALEFTALFARYPTAANLHYFCGYLLFASDPDRAMSEFREELTVTPHSAAAAAMLAWAWLMRSDPAAAIPFGTQAVADDLALPLAQLTLGRALIETGALAPGIAHLEQARKLEPNNLETHLALARAYSSANRPQEARSERLLSLQLAEDHAPSR